MTQDPSRSPPLPPLSSISTPVRSSAVALASERDGLPGAHQDSDQDLQWRCDFAWKIFDQNQELIRSTDQKTYNLIVMSTLLISLSSANVERFVVRAGAREVALAVLVVSCVNFFVHALSTLFARASTTTPAPSKSMIFFGHIVSHPTATGYRDQFTVASKTELLDDLVTQVSVVSMILQRKMASYRRSWMAAALEVGAFLLMVLFGRFL
jgi:hypothetical protein